MQVTIYTQTKELNEANISKFLSKNIVSHIEKFIKNKSKLIKINFLKKEFDPNIDIIKFLK